MTRTYLDGFNLWDKLQDAYWRSAPSYNLYERTINSIKWDDTFEADGEYYFVKGGHTFTTPSLDPFDMPWSPSMLFADGSSLSFKGEY